MRREQVADWVANYERLWRTPGTAGLASIFTQAAIYLQGPYREPVTGLPAIAQMWDDERACPAEVFQMTSEIVAVDGSTAVVKVEVFYGEPVEQEYRDLWIIRFAEDGRSYSFEEWPYWPPESGAGRT